MKSNKSQKKVQQNKKLKKALIITGASLLGASAIIIPPAIILTRHQSDPEISTQIEITFNCEYGFKSESNQSKTFKVKRNSTIASINVPTINFDNVPASAGSFCGWASSADFIDGKIQSSKIIKATAKQANNINLTAVFKNNVSDGDSVSWYRIQFASDTENKSTVSGNTYFEIPAASGFTFADLNKPSISVPTGYVFKFWTRDGSTEFKSSNKFTADTVIFPKLELGTTIKFVPGQNAKIVSGSDSIQVELNSAFGSIVVPTVEWIGENSKTFAGWYLQDGSASGIWDESKLCNENTVFTASTNIYARWMTSEEATTEGYGLINTLKPSTNWEYDSNTSFYVKQNLTFNKFAHPHPQTNEQKVVGWEYSTDYTEESPETATWTELDPETYVLGETSQVWIRPIMKAAITNMYIAITDQEEKEIPLFTTNTAFTATSYVIPTALQQDVVWKIQKWDSTTSSWVDPTEEEVTINETNPSSISATVISETVEKIRLVATSVYDYTESITQELIKNTPYSKNMNFYTTINGEKYGLLGIDDKFTDNISLVKSDGKTVKEKVSKATFDYPVYIAADVTEIPNNFLANCFSFNNTIIRQESALSKITVIGDNFLQNAMNFNNASVNNLLSGVVSIGNNFMQNNIKFNACNLSLPKVVAIGDSFLQNNTQFNQVISFISSDESNSSCVKSIGNSFLSDCISFSQNIEFPYTLNYLGTNCMYNCDSYTSVIRMSANPSLSGIDQGTTMFSTSNSSCPYATTGFKWLGYYSLQASKIWANLDGGSSRIYRKSANSAKPIIAVAMTSTPSKVVYIGDDKFTTASTVLTLTYDDTSTDTVTWDGTGTAPWTTSIPEGTTLTEPGTHTVTLSYAGFDCTFDITVFDRQSVGNLAYCRVTKAGGISTHYRGLNLSFSTDGGVNWTTMDDGTNYPFNKGDIVFLKGTANPITTYSKTRTLLSLNNGIGLVLGGKISALLNNGQEWDQSQTPSEWALANLINGSGSQYDPESSPGLTAIEEGFFNIEKASSNLYCWSFANNHNLTRIPSSIGIKSLGSGATEFCRYMFTGCCNNLGTGLTKLPDNFKLPNVVSDACYRNMFWACKNLQEVPDDMLPDVSVCSSIPTDTFNSIFWECPALKKPPKFGNYTIGTTAFVEFFNGSSDLWITDDSNQEGAVEFFTCPSDVATANVSMMFCSCKNKTEDGHDIWTADGTPYAGKTYYYIPH